MVRFYLGLAAVLISTSVARADPNSVRFDLGYMWDRVAVSDNTTIDGHLVRFGFSVALGALHFGAEVDDAWLEGTTTRPDGALARTMTVPAGSPVTGTSVAPKVVVGAHTSGRIVTLAAELAGGVRDTGVSSDYGDDFAGRKMEPLVEVRSRVDLWLAPSWSIGAVAATDVLVRDDLSFGLVLASHL